MYQYVLWGDVQKQLYALSEKGKDHVSFYDAFLSIDVTKIKKSDMIPIPDFYSWDCRDADDFYTLICEFPVLLETMLLPPSKNTRHGHPIFKTHATTDLALMFQARKDTAFCESDSFTFRYILKGSADLEYSGRHFALNAGDIVLFPPHHPIGLLLRMTAWQSLSASGRRNSKLFSARLCPSDSCHPAVYP